MGYRIAITYTEAGESGASLRAAGFEKVKDLPARPSWADSSVKLKGKRDPAGNGNVARTLWMCRLASDSKAKHSDQMDKESQPRGE